MAFSFPLLSNSSSSGGSSIVSGADSETASISDDAASSSSTSPGAGPHKSLAVLSGHAGTVSCLALCGNEFLLSASLGRDIILWQQPDLRPLARFGDPPDDPSAGSPTGFVKALVVVGARVFTAHQDSRIRVWKLSRNPESPFKLAATLPTARDYLGHCMKQSNYVQTRRHHRKLWIEHADSISCLAVHRGLIYSGSWDKTLKVWSLSKLNCLESIRAHDDAINALAAHAGLLYSASADGKIKIWGKESNAAGRDSHCLKGILQGHSDVCWNSVIVCENGRLVYGGGSDGRIMGWEREGMREEWRLVFNVKAHDKAVLCLCSAGGGDFVCSGSADKSIGVWRRERSSNYKGRLCKVGVMRGHEGPVKCLQASEMSVGGGFMLYSGGLDKRLRVWWVPKEYGEVTKNEGLQEEEEDDEEEEQEMGSVLLR